MIAAAAVGFPALLLLWIVGWVLEVEGLAVPASRSNTKVGGREGTGGTFDLANRRKNLEVREEVEIVESAEVE